MHHLHKAKSVRTFLTIRDYLLVVCAHHGMTTEDMADIFGEDHIFVSRRRVITLVTPVILNGWVHSEETDAIGVYRLSSSATGKRLIKNYFRSIPSKELVHSVLSGMTEETNLTTLQMLTLLSIDTTGDKGYRTPEVFAFNKLMDLEFIREDRRITKGERYVLTKKGKDLLKLYYQLFSI